MLNKLFPCNFWKTTKVANIVSKLHIHIEIHISYTILYQRAMWLPNVNIILWKNFMQVLAGFKVGSRWASFSQWWNFWQVILHSISHHSIFWKHSVSEFPISVLEFDTKITFAVSTISHYYVGRVSSMKVCLRL